MNPVEKAGFADAPHQLASADSSRSSSYYYWWVPAILALYFAVQAAIRIAISNSLRIDEAQQFLVGQWLAWGYDAQPPLYNWLQYSIFEIFGTNVASLVIVKNLLLFLVYFSYHNLLRSLLADKRLAAIGTLSLLTMPQMFWQAQRDLTHTVATLLAVIMVIHFVVVTIRRPTVISYAMIGLWAGLGMLTKYNFALVVISVLVATFFHPDGRKRLLDWRLLLTLAIAVLVFLPHAVWMVSNMDRVLTTTVHTMSEQGAGSKVSDIGFGVVELVKTGVAIVAPTTVIFLLIFRQSFLRSLRARSEWSDFVGRIFSSTTVILLALILVITLTEFRDRWLLPFLFLLPLYFCLKLDAAGEQSQTDIKRFLYVPAAMMVALPLIVGGGVLFARFFHSYEHLNTPYATFVDKVIATQGKQPSAVVTTTWHKAGNIRVNMPHTRVISTEYPASDLSEQVIGDGPVLLVWNERDGHQSGMPNALKQWFTSKFGAAAQLPAQQDIALPYYYGKDPDRYHFGYAWYDPKPK
ncbi:glycosyltransferase family 39 protein [Rhizobium sp. NPDC090279]|uniref:glycosyltransferase family 39 protein n=1 Tax=Rhizobium sp. NPDC090279 TaxID=3364499 RepID=UPI00383B2C09